MGGPRVKESIGSLRVLGFLPGVVYRSHPAATSLAEAALRGDHRCQRRRRVDRAGNDEHSRGVDAAESASIGAFIGSLGSPLREAFGESDADQPDAGEH